MITAAFEEWRINRNAIHRQQVAQSLRPHNTPQWFVLSIYLREWFFEYPKEDECKYDSGITLLEDMQARFPRCDYNLADFMFMLHEHYGMIPGEGVIFTRADIFAPYAQARSFEELDKAKLLA
jgi:hypothetical protein